MIIASSSKILTLSEWTTTWLMDFNICKCAILPITKMHNKSFLYYTSFVNAIEHVDDHEYPGISISHYLCWENHCDMITKNANLKLLKKTCNLNIFQIIEYYASIFMFQKLNSTVPNVLQQNRFLSYSYHTYETRNNLSIRTPLFKLQF